MIIAIDGPAASGKGTLAKQLAEHFALAYLDTGSLYRAVAQQILCQNKDPADLDAALEAARTLDMSAHDESSLRTAEVGAAASVVAAMPAVRQEMLKFQRHFAATPGGAVLDGRDIGTVVCPDADIKLYVSASPQVRAQRRFDELRATDPQIMLGAVMADLQERDSRDRNRNTSPMKPAETALLLDTSDLDIEAAFKRAVHLVESQLSA